MLLLQMLQLSDRLHQLLLVRRLLHEPLLSDPQHPRRLHGFVRLSERALATPIDILTTCVQSDRKSSTVPGIIGVICFDIQDRKTDFTNSKTLVSVATASRGPPLPEK